MITIIHTPENFTPAFTAVNYILDMQSDLSFEVKILDATGTETLGVKRYNGIDEHSVSLGDYLQYRFDIQPISSGFCQLFKDETKLVGVCIKPDTLDFSDPTWHTFAVDQAVMLSPMSDAPLQRTLSWNDRDELSILVEDAAVSASYTFFSDSGVDLELPLESVTVENAVVTLATDMPTLEIALVELGYDPNEFSSFSLELKTSGVTLFSVDYQIDTLDDKPRLCWLNSYGALDFFSFNSFSEASASVAKQRVYGAGGYKVTSSELLCTNTYFTPFLNKTDMSFLLGLLASPKVWLQRSDGYEPLDIITSSLDYDTEDLMRLELKTRSVLNKNLQHD